MGKENRVILGESPLWSKELGSWFYVDIIRGIIYKKNAFGEREMKRNIPFISNVVAANKGFLLSANNTLFTTDFEFSNFKTLTEVDMPGSMRTNDGSVGPDGRYWFGTMEKKPTGLNGSIYSVDRDGMLIKQASGIGIPNTFVWINESEVLVSDSFLQQTFKIELLPDGSLDWKNRQVWLDLGATNGTPDGGALDIDNNLWLAVWGEAGIHQYSPNGELIKKLHLPALQPTSCAFGAESMSSIMITSATEGMSRGELHSYPDSGRLLYREMEVSGAPLSLFNIR